MADIEKIQCHFKLLLTLILYEKHWGGILIRLVFHVSSLKRSLIEVLDKKAYEVLPRAWPFKTTMRFHLNLDTWKTRWINVSIQCFSYKNLFNLYLAFCNLRYGAYVIIINQNHKINCLFLWWKFAQKFEFSSFWAISCGVLFFYYHSFFGWT